MTELSQLLGNVEELNEEVADSIRGKLDEELEFPDNIKILDDKPEVASDDTGDWIIVQFEIDGDRHGEIYALAGAYTLQVYNGGTFLKPTTTVEELNRQLKSIK